MLHLKSPNSRNLTNRPIFLCRKKLVHEEGKNSVQGISEVLSPPLLIKKVPNMKTKAILQRWQGLTPLSVIPTACGKQKYWKHSMICVRLVALSGLWVNHWHYHFFSSPLFLWALSQNGSKATWQDNKDSDVFPSTESRKTIWILRHCLSQRLFFLSVMLFYHKRFILILLCAICSGVHF